MRSRCSMTPRTRASVWGLVGPSPSAMAASIAPTGSCPRISAAYRMSSARLRALVRAAIGSADGVQDFTRPRYDESRVSTLTFSPCVMNSGTWISWPVSSVAGLVRPVALSPATPGSV